MRLCQPFAAQMHGSDDQVSGVGAAGFFFKATVNKPKATVDAPIFAAAKAAAGAVVKPKADLVNFLQQLGYSQYAVPLAAAGFACMKELTVINMAALKNVVSWMAMH